MWWSWTVCRMRGLRMMSVGGKGVDIGWSYKLRCPLHSLLRVQDSHDSLDNYHPHGSSEPVLPCACQTDQEAPDVAEVLFVVLNVILKMQVSASWYALSLTRRRVSHPATEVGLHGFFCCHNDCPNRIRCARLGSGGRRCPLSPIADLTQGTASAVLPVNVGQLRISSLRFAQQAGHGLRQCLIKPREDKPPQLRLPQRLRLGSSLSE
jgi:hypothetical protein